ncbi:hypothetical protein ASF71_18965 [Deinococcus sp. Leaf326]|nr:hypothetical protein ASF71_18965 [Deinococcus sp. Leaf326]
MIIPGTTGGLSTLVPGVQGFYLLLILFAHSYFTGRPLPGAFGELLARCIAMMGVHQIRGSLADRANAQNGLGPVPVDPSDPAQGTPAAATPGRLPDPRPTAE